jgi:hypothetical protein
MSSWSATPRTDRHAAARGEVRRAGVRGPGLAVDRGARPVDNRQVQEKGPWSSPAQQRPDDGRVVAGRDAELHVPVAQPGVVSADAHVGQQRDDQAGAHRHTVDRRDDRLLAVDDVVDQVAHLVEHPADPAVVARHPVHHGQVAAGRERPARPGHHGDPGLLVGGHVLPHPGQLGVHHLVGRVVAVRAVQRDQQHAILAAVEEQSGVTGVVHVRAGSFPSRQHSRQAIRQPSRQARLMLSRVHDGAQCGVLLFSNIRVCEPGLPGTPGDQVRTRPGRCTRPPPGEPRGEQHER